jgi:hypothetical protein
VVLGNDSRVAVQVDPVGFLGREFIAYVSGAEPQLIDTVAADASHPDHGRLQLAVSRCAEVLLQHWPTYVPAFVKVPSDADVSRANLIRLEAGRELPRLPELGGLLEPLVRIARDVFPAWLLAPLRQPGFMTDSTPSLRLVGDLGDHPATAEFRDRLAADELSDLFKSDPDDVFSFASGTGVAAGLDLLVPSLLGTAAVRARLTAREFSLMQSLPSFRR